MAELVCCYSLHFLDHVSSRIGRECSDEKVDMVRLYCQVENIPSFQQCLFADNPLAISGNGVSQNSLSPLRAPDKVVDNKVDPMLVSLIFHVEYISYINIIINNFPAIYAG